MAPTNSEPVYFWKPESENGYLGQWYPYMMHQKGLLFAPDDPVTHQILSQDSTPPHPAELRSLGRQIPDFDDAVWKKHRYKIVVEGNYLKFTQDPQLKAKLLATRDRELVEASPRDRIWGVGFGAKNAGVRRKNWGLNLLGKALMEVKERIRKELLEEEELAIGGGGGGGGGEKAV
ncbi:hypothetical protein RJ035_006789 [Blastomyces gilchristii]